MPEIVTWIIIAIIGVLVLLFFSSLGVKVWGDISNFLEEYGIGTKRTNVEKAILCSYLRCTVGCNSMEVEKLYWEEQDPKDPSKKKQVRCMDFCIPPLSLTSYECDPDNCYSCYDCKKCVKAGCSWCFDNVCLPTQDVENSPNYQIAMSCVDDESKCLASTKGGGGYTDVNKLTICGYEAIQYPVNITLSEAETISESHLSNIGAKIGTFSWTTGKPAFEGLSAGNCVLVEGDVKYGNPTGDCFGRYVTFDQLELNPGNYSIYTESFDLWILGKHEKTTIKSVS